MLSTYPAQVVGKNVVTPDDSIWLYRWECKKLVLNPEFKQLWNLLIWSTSLNSSECGLLLGQYLDAPGDGPNRNYPLTTMDCTASELSYKGAWTLLPSPYGTGPVSLVDGSSLILQGQFLNYRISWSGLGCGQISFYSDPYLYNRTLMSDIDGNLCQYTGDTGSFVTWNYTNIQPVATNSCNLFVEIMIPDREVDELVPSTRYFYFERCGIKYRFPIYHLRFSSDGMVNVIADSGVRDVATAMYKYLQDTSIGSTNVGGGLRSDPFIVENVEMVIGDILHTILYPCYMYVDSIRPTIQLNINRMLCSVGLKLYERDSKCVTVIELNNPPTNAYSFKVAALTPSNDVGGFVPMMSPQRVLVNGRYITVDLPCQENLVINSAQQTRVSQHQGAQMDGSQQTRVSKYTSSFPINYKAGILILSVTFLTQSGRPIGLGDVPDIKYDEIIIS
jgi:hypothetical protein